MNKLQRNVHNLMMHHIGHLHKQWFLCVCNANLGLGIDPNFTEDLKIEMKKKLKKYVAKQEKSWYNVAFLRKMTQIDLRIPPCYKPWQEIVAEFIVYYTIYCLIITCILKELEIYMNDVNNNVDGENTSKIKRSNLFYGTLPERFEQMEKEENEVFFPMGKSQILFAAASINYFFRSSLVVITVTPETVNELLETDPPLEWQAPTIYKSALFLIPKDTLKDDKDQPVDMILIHDGTVFDQYSSDMMPVYETSSRILTILFIGKENIQLVRLNGDLSLEQNLGFSPEERKDSRIAKQIKIVEFAVQLLLLLASEDPPVFFKVPERPYHHKDKTTKAETGDPLSVVEPRILHIHPKPVVRYVSSSTGQTKGTPKRPHVRRAHWHSVRCGPNREQIKKVWIKTTYIKHTPS